MTPAEQARVSAGLSLQQAAQRLRVSARYLAHCERHGFSWPLANRAARLYRASLNSFLQLSGRRRGANDNSPAGSPPGRAPQKSPLSR